MLTPHLKCAGFEVTHEPATYENGYLIYVPPVDLQEIPSSFIAILNRYPKDKTLFLLTIEKENQTLPKELKGLKGLKAAKYANYYLYVLEILKTFFPGSKIDPIISNFKEKYEKVSNPAQLDHPRLLSSQIKEEKSFFLTQLLPIMSSRKWFTAMVLIIICCISIGFLSFCWQAGYGSRQHLIAQSELSLPTKSVFLERPELLSEIDREFNQTADIQTVALVGIGGAGKTTMARKYAHQQRVSIVWEVNAEASGGLYSSFEKLGSALSITEKDQKILRRLLDIKNATEKTEKLINFVKERLKLHSPWFLIFDNVENFSNIQKYFPQNTKTWGQGKVILTTRNINIQNNNLVNHVISIGELTSEQKRELFTKIMNGKTLIAKNGEILRFLERIPPFPLDVSVAAYYLKSTNIPYAQYLKKLDNYTKETNELHENILKETGAYTNTRYAIITHSLEHLLKKNTDFAGLLLFISLLNSQNIPKSLLDQYKHSNIVDNFVYHLKKYSLVTAQSMSASSNPMYSIHRSTQTISVSYLTELLKLKKDSPLLTQIANTLDDYADKIIEQEDFANMKMMAQHIEKLLNHSNLLTDFSKGLLESKLGVIYYFINGDKSKKLLDDSLNILKSKSLENLSSEDRSRLARSLLNIGSVYTELRLDKEAQEVLEKAVHIYRQEKTKNYAGLFRALSYVGNIHRKLGNYEKARNYLKESIYLQKQHGANDKCMVQTLAYLGATYRGLGAYQQSINTLEESLALYKKYFSDDHFRAGWILVQLGQVYRDLGDTKQGKEYLGNGLLVFQKCLPDHHVSIGITLAYLGNCYRELGEYEKSRSYLEQSLKIHQQHFDKNHVKMGWVLFHLASTYKAIDQHQEAQKLFNTVFGIYSNHCSEKNIATAKVLRNMAKICLEKKRLDEAENFIERSLKILNAHHHVEAYKSLKTLGEIYFKKAVEPTYAKNNQERAYLEKQALSSFNQALSIAKQNLPPHSIHIEKINARLKRIQQKN